ncbi:retropepsin-like aspartic protease [Zymomonas sp.]|uniref:retropepsin-like aspartic protease n=1 Tax=Zymomonas sp. TaxID=2068624 RepID=UPI0025FFDE87|nr:retropepsin-like aspartic protease [Zymomonas sp.]MCA1956797.1 retropepsin-like domain-containing protein [Zymomonas sp.]
MPKKYRFLLYPFFLNALLLPPLEAEKPLISPKLIEFLKQYRPEDLKNGMELRSGGDEMLKGLSEGDDLLIDKVAKDLSDSRSVQKFAEINKLRVKGDYQNANKLLDINTFFQKSDMIDPLPPISGVGIISKQTLVGNYFLDGNLKAWGKTLDFIRNVYYPPIRKIAGLEEFSLTDAEMGRLSVSPNSIPPFKVTGINHQQSIPLQFDMDLKEKHRRSANHIPHITASLNGKDIPFFLETCAAISKLPEEWRHSPHVHIVGHLDRATNGASEFFSGDLGIVDEIKIGKAVLKNVPVLLADVSQPYLGLMVLQKLGKIKIDKQQMTFGKDINCNCQQDIHLGSAFGGDFQSLQYPITWQGHSRLAVVDFTREDSLYNLLTYKPEFTSQEKEKSFEVRPNPNRKELKYEIYFDQGNLSIDNMDYGQKKEIVIEDNTSRLATIIGLSIVDKADLYLDFINHKACLKSIQ